MYFFKIKILSYFAKPNFIIYDEWFDEDLKKTKINEEIKKTNSISNIHQFFYEQSNYKIGASENNFQLDLKGSSKKLITNYHLKNTSKKYSSLSKKQFWLFEQLTKKKLKFIYTKKLIYSLSIFGFVFIFGFLLFFISQSKKDGSNISNGFFILEKEF